MPAAQLDGPELDPRLLVDHREHLIRSLFYGRWAPRVARRLARAEQTMRVRIARDELRRIRELSQTITAREREIAALVGEVAGASRFSSDAKLARAAGAPIPVSSGKTNRHRPDRGGNRQINATIHRIAATRLRCHPETQDYIARKRSEGKSTKEAIRCLKRHLARRIWHPLQAPHPNRGTPPSPSISRHRSSESSSARRVAKHAPRAWKAAASERRGCRLARPSSTRDDSSDSANGESRTWTTR